MHDRSTAGKGGRGCCRVRCQTSIAIARSTAVATARSSERLLACRRGRRRRGEEGKKERGGGSAIDGYFASSSAVAARAGQARQRVLTWGMRPKHSRVPPSLCQCHRTFWADGRARPRAARSPHGTAGGNVASTEKHLLCFVIDPTISRSSEWAQGFLGRPRGGRHGQCGRTWPISQPRRIDWLAAS